MTRCPDTVPRPYGGVRGTADEKEGDVRMHRRRRRGRVRRFLGGLLEWAEGIEAGVLLLRLLTAPLRLLLRFLE